MRSPPPCSPLLSLPPHHFPCPASSALFTSKTPPLLQETGLSASPSPPPPPPNPAPRVPSGGGPSPQEQTAADRSEIFSRGPYVTCPCSGGRGVENIRPTSERAIGGAVRAPGSPLLSSARGKQKLCQRAAATVNMQLSAHNNNNNATVIDTEPAVSLSLSLSCPDTYCVLSWKLLLVAAQLSPQDRTLAALARPAGPHDTDLRWWLHSSPRLTHATLLTSLAGTFFSLSLSPPPAREVKRRLGGEVDEEEEEEGRWWW